MAGHLISKIFAFFLCSLPFFRRLSVALKNGFHELAAVGVAA
jgi:hypothetical protein